MKWDLDEIRKVWPKKFKDERFIFQEIRPGDKIFIGTGCGEPQYLVQALLNNINKNPKAFLDTELINIVTLGVAPYTDEKFRDNFRLKFFFRREQHPKSCKQRRSRLHAHISICSPQFNQHRENTD